MTAYLFLWLYFMDAAVSFIARAAVRGIAPTIGARLTMSEARDLSMLQS